MHNKLKQKSRSHKILSKALEQFRGELFANGVMRNNIAQNLATLKEARKVADMEGDFTTVSGAARAQNVLKAALRGLLRDRVRIVGQLTVIGEEVRDLKARILVLDAEVEKANAVKA